MAEGNQMGMDQEERDALTFSRLLLAVVLAVVSVLAAADGRRWRRSYAAGRGRRVWKNRENGMLWAWTAEKKMGQAHLKILLLSAHGADGPNKTTALWNFPKTLVHSSERKICILVDRQVLLHSGVHFFLSRFSWCSQTQVLLLIIDGTIRNCPQFIYLFVFVFSDVLYILFSINIGIIKYQVDENTYTDITYDEIIAFICISLCVVE